MSFPRSPSLVLPFVAITYSNFPLDLIAKFGEVLVQSKSFVLSKHTDYYKKEMGDSLEKTIYILKQPIAPDAIIKFKLLSFEEENRYSTNNKRTINIDPGYIDLPKVVLTSFKNFSHRIYLADGVYAEVTLIYNKEKNTYTELPWTYPDYKSNETLDPILEGRSYLHRILSKR
ncbi:MAG: DUF4416 family protein [Planctomycetes bacterium]|nr:DUF4416 family protein [Planctomycetota bacterium]